MSEITAYHEAGHALVAHLLGGKVKQVTIDPDSDGPERYGDTQIRWKRGLGDKDFAQKTVRVSLAGPVAEMIYSGEPYHPGVVPEWAADWRDAWEAAQILFPNERQQLEYLENTSIELYRQMQQDDFWSAVAGIADHLLAHDTLEADEFKELVGELIESLVTYQDE